MTNTLPPTPGHAPSGRYAPDTMLSLSEIADLLGRDLKTIKTWLDKGNGRWPNAVQDATGRRAWCVPVADLVTSGDLEAAQIAHVENELATRRESRETKALREQVIRLEEQLVAARDLADERAATITLLKGLVRKGGAA
jgi:hypothetical protein